MLSQLNDELLPETKEQLDTEMSLLIDELARLKVHIQHLFAQENHEQGIFFAQEIFQAQQDKLTREVQFEFRRKKKNRLALWELENPL